MIVFLLISILAGSFATALAAGFGGASWGMIALGYVLGGWIGLIGGGLVLAVACRVRKLRRGGPARSLRQQKADR